MFKPHIIGEADFANGTAFRIVQVKEGGSCKITDLNTDKYSYAGSIAKAWSSVRYQSSITQRTENTTGWRGDTPIPRTHSERSQHD